MKQESFLRFGSYSDNTDNAIINEIKPGHHKMSVLSHENWVQVPSFNPTPYH
jgi:hypothetical protein